MQTPIKTLRLHLIPCDADILSSAIEGNESLAAKLNVSVPEQWSEFGVEALEYAREKLAESKREAGWWTYFPIHTEDNQLIGSGGFAGSPSPQGTVEIGYEIIEAYRGKGLATEMVKGLVRHAFEHKRVHTVIAHTLGKENPSTSVLRKCNFDIVAEINDPDEGMIWRWERRR